MMLKDYVLKNYRVLSRNKNHDAYKNKDTPFNLAFRSNVVILVEIRINSLLVAYFNLEQNNLVCRPILTY